MPNGEKGGQHSFWRWKVEESIPICELFYRIAMDIRGPLLETNQATNIF
jgi:hypothetical protein